jgi:Cu-Zn family superoxide dismutase
MQYTFTQQPIALLQTENLLVGNFIADENGNGTISKTTDEWCIGCADTTKDVLGKAIIVHAGADDFTSQPSGAAGARVSCAGIIQ